MTLAAIALVLAAAAPPPPASVSPGAAAAPELAAYRAFARSDSAAALLATARRALAWGVAESGGEPAVPASPPWPAAPRPVYVTLVQGSRVRACVGADTPLDATLGGTVWRLAVRALTEDRRRAPVRAGELDSLRVVIAFAGDAAPVGDPYAVQPLREGLKLETSRGAIAFLPGEARTVAWALGEARRAGVLAGPVSEARCSRFPVVVIREPAAPPGRHRSVEGAAP
jgi:hypothetical protein